MKVEAAIDSDTAVYADSGRSVSGRGYIGSRTDTTVWADSR
jgi:hypothetical protein